MRLSLKKLMSLPDYLLVYPGHGETSMIGEEKRTNPFLNNRSKISVLVVAWVLAEFLKCPQPFDYVWVG